MTVIPDVASKRYYYHHYYVLLFPVRFSPPAIQAESSRKQKLIFFISEYIILVIT